MQLCVKVHFYTSHAESSVTRGPGSVGQNVEIKICVDRCEDAQFLRCK